MSDLSILAAAREAPDRPAIVDEQGTLTFAELAERAMALTAPSPTRAWLAPRAVRDDVARILGMLERRVGFLLAHARWTAHERDAAIARVGAGTAAAREQVLVFTSGSAGRPKVVRLSHEALVAAAAAHALALPWRDDDAWLLCLPLGHVGGLSVLTRSLYARRPVILAPEPFDPDALAALAGSRRATLASLVPAMLAALSDRPPPTSLRAVLLGGAAAAPSLVARARAAGWPVLPTYGASETAAQVCAQRLGDERPTGVGPPLPGLEVRVRGGVIEVRGPTLMLGYLDDPSPLDEGWLRTGDLGRIDAEGHLHVLGRADEVLITGGENVDPREVEDALLAHPRITEAIVLGVPDPRWGQRVVALIAGASAPGEDEVHEHLRGRLAPYKRPRTVAFVRELPRLPSGKVDRARVLGALGAPGARPEEPEWGSQ